eukprot:scaffold140366_cov51-Attheya_sp.AAC.1
MPSLLDAGSSKDLAGLLTPPSCVNDVAVADDITATHEVAAVDDVTAADDEAAAIVIISPDDVHAVAARGVIPVTATEDAVAAAAELEATYIEACSSDEAATAKG